jgi:diaminopimelate decarboxylase
MTVYEVGTVKPVALDGGASRVYVSVDGGMSDNIRTPLYDAAYSCVLASRRSSAPPVLSRVVGKHCESGDVVVKDVWLPSDVVPGDLLAVAATGAYGRSMASNYNHVPRPPVVAVSTDGARTMVRRETVEDLLALDEG